MKTFLRTKEDIRADVEEIFSDSVSEETIGFMCEVYEYTRSSYVRGFNDGKAALLDKAISLCFSHE